MSQLPIPAPNGIRNLPAVDPLTDSNGDSILADYVLTADMQSATTKSTPIDADSVILIDSAASNAIKRTLWSSLKATLKTYFDTLYQAVLVSGTNIKTVNSTSLLGSGNLTVTATDPNAQSSSVTYNTDGTIATKTLADGTVTTFTYSSAVLTQSDRAKTGSLTVRKVFAYSATTGLLSTVTRTEF